MSNNNVAQGKSRLVFARDDADTEWQILGFVASCNISGTATTESTTSQATVGEFTEKQAVPYKDLSVQLQGKLDRRSGTHASGYTIAEPSRLTELWLRTGSNAHLLILNAETGGRLEGFFTIGSITTNSTQEGLIDFSASLESSGETNLKGIV